MISEKKFKFFKFSEAPKNLKKKYKSKSFIFFKFFKFFKAPKNFKKKFKSQSFIFFKFFKFFGASKNLKNLKNLNRRTVLRDHQISR